MKKVYLFLADGFELIEALTPYDVLKRCGADVVGVALSDDKLVKSAQGISVLSDISINDANFEDADLIIIPGGYPGYVNLRENEKVVSVVKKAIDNSKYVGAICGGPTIFSSNGLARGISLTAHSSTKQDFENNYAYSGKNVEIDGNIITAIGAGHSLDFAFSLASRLYDEDTIKRVKKAMEV